MIAGNLPKDFDMTTMKNLQISLTHVTHEDRKILMDWNEHDRGPNQPMQSTRYRSGAHVSTEPFNYPDERPTRIHSMIEAGLSDDFVNLLQAAHERGAQVLTLDDCGLIDPTLPTFARTTGERMMPLNVQLGRNDPIREPVDMLDISTAHVTSDDNDVLSAVNNMDEVGSEIPVQVESYEWGYYVHSSAADLVHGRETDEKVIEHLTGFGLSEDFARVLILARNERIPMVRFDADADTDDRLPTHDWQTGESYAPGDHEGTPLPPPAPASTAVRPAI